MGVNVNDSATIITNLYRTVIGEGGSGPVDRRDAILEVYKRVQPLIESGDLVPDVYAWVKTEVMAADKRDGESVDKTLDALSAGEEDDLSLGVTPNLDKVVVLGGGRRKTFRYVALEDIDEMDELRHRNVRSVNRSYHKDWKPAHDGWRAVLLRYPTILDAIEADDRPTREADLFGGAA